MKNNISLIYTGFIAIFAMASFFISCNSNDSTSGNNSDQDSVKLRTERGKYLANYVSGCIDCHSQRDYTKFSGLIVPGSEGKVCDSNNAIKS